MDGRREKYMMIRLVPGLAAVLVVVAFAASASALPIYAVAAARECDTCHIEPLGWANPDFSSRRCTLDCAGCHVSTAGGALRTADGQYFGKEVLPIWGERPSQHANPEQYLPKGYPTEGKYVLGEGFSGWWAGNVPHTEIGERYGNINPTPKWNIGGDFRATILNQSVGDASETFFFPMQADVYALNESVRDLQLFVNGGLQGYKDTSRYGDVEAKDYFAVKELFMKYRFKDYGAYVRAGRFVPRYGWRIPDHTAFIREDLGFDQYFQVMGADVAINPQYFYADASAYFQGLQAWPGDVLRRGTGTTANLGYRALGWQVGTSFHYFDERGTTRPDGTDDGIKQLTTGLTWGVNLHPFVYYGELDYRRLILPAPFDEMMMMEGEKPEPVGRMFAYHELNYEFTRGVFGKLKYDWGDANIQFVDNHKHRVTLGFDVYPYTFVHFELLYRLNYGAESPVTRLFDSRGSDLMLITHLWF